MDKVRLKIDCVIKDYWIQRLPLEYGEGHLFKEDSLKCSLYRYIRNELSDEWCKRHKIRIYPELLLDERKRADIAIVKVSSKDKREKNYLGDCIEEVLCLIELKYKGYSLEKIFFEDVAKMRDYSKIYPDTSLYLGFIHEAYYDIAPTFIDKRQSNNWGRDRLVEMIGYCAIKTEGLITLVNTY